MKENNKSINELREQFANLNKKQQILHAYRNILQNKDDSLKSVLKMAPASNFNVGLFRILFFLKLNNIQSLEKIKINDLYKEALISYKKVLEEYRDLAFNFNFTNTLELSQFFSYLLWNGYFSVTKVHNYSLTDNAMWGKVAFDVINGTGVCIAYAELLHDFLNVCGKQSAILNCKFPDFSLSLIKNKIGDHSVNLIEDNGKLSVYDATQVCVLNILNSDIASAVGYDMHYRLRPLETLLFNSSADPYHLFERLLSDDILPAYTKYEVNRNYNNIKLMTQNNMNVLDESYNKIYKELKIINKEIKSDSEFYKEMRRKK